ncbi:MAG: VWA domain-containing protein, partial [Pseudomonadota bacterium]
FSDLKEDLQEGYVRDFSMTFTDVDVVAMNVTKLRSDNVDPREYLSRLSDWETRVQQSGGSWRVINDLDRLERLFQS